MDLTECFAARESLLLEGALGERLKREYRLEFDGDVVMAGLVYREEGRRALEALWGEYAAIAGEFSLPLLATTPTRRVNRERVGRSRFSQAIVQDNLGFLRQVQARQGVQMYAGGLLGCRGDAYTGEGALGLEEAREFHRWEGQLFAEAGADFLYAALLPTLEEASGMALALSEFGIPYLLSFTVNRDGCLVDGTEISRAISHIDSLVDSPPLCYMSNCVHPTLLYEALSQPFNRTSAVRERFAGLQANTSPLPYGELDGSKDLKSSPPRELAGEMMRLRQLLPLKIFGGCCGTDGRHLREIARRIASPCRE